MIRRWFQTAFILSVSATALYSQDRETLLEKVAETTGWKASAVPSIYDGSGLADYSADLAPTLDLYGVEGVATQEWTTPQGIVRATLFEMLDSPAAYGFYTLQRTSPATATPTLIGAGSFLRENQVFFWQSNYAVRIEGPEAARSALARLLSESIRGPSQRPPVSEYLPPANLVEGSEKYLLSPDAIDRAVGVPADALGFDYSAEAATATYRIDGKQAQLLLLLYPTQHVARKFDEALEPAWTSPSAFRKRDGPLLAVVYGSTDANAAESILRGVSHGFKVTWNEAPPGLGLGTMIVTIFTFIGVALVFTTLMGLGFGGLRVFFKSRYPNRVFDRPEQMEIIQLKLFQGLTDKQIEDGSRTGGG